VSGFYGIDPSDRVECFARVPFPLAADIAIDGAWLSKSPDRVQPLAQSYDFSCGELRSRFVFDGGTSRIEVEVLTFCSRTMPSLVLQELAITASSACELAVCALLDEVGVEGRASHRENLVADRADAALLWESAGALSSCGVALATEFSGGEAERTQRQPEEGELGTTYTVRARRDRRYVLRQIASIVPSASHHQPDQQARRLLTAAGGVGWNELREQNRAAWEEIWKGRVELLGADERWQAIADASFFYLQTSVHPSSPSSTALFGLSYWPDYHYYRGHIMWDLEFFALPPLALTNPDAARALLAFRFERLDAAGHNARMSGYRGLQFPWESSIRRGEESTPGDATGAAVEHHVSLDVAHAFAQFAYASGDRRFMAERAWPVLQGVAEWIASRVERTSRGFELHRVCGIAEKEPPVDNSAFMNMGSVVVLGEAAEIGRALGHDTPPRWDEIAERLFIPMDAQHARIISHDRFRANEEKGATPDPLAGFFPFGYEASPGVEQRTAEFYLARADEYVGAPMLSSLLGVWAARAGNRQRSSALFERGYADFLFEPFSMIDEYSPSVFPDMTRAGPFTANLGGFLTGLLYGLTGLRPSIKAIDTWCQGPVQMPSLWEGVRVERIFARGEPMELLARQGDERPILRRL
jgi:trehalose/maltose hydrolase-like predicted phosphorylase